MNMVFLRCFINGHSHYLYWFLFFLFQRAPTEFVSRTTHTFGYTMIQSGSLLKSYQDLTKYSNDCSTFIDDYSTFIDLFVIFWYTLWDLIPSGKQTHPNRMDLFKDELSKMSFINIGHHNGWPPVSRKSLLENYCQRRNNYFIVSRNR